MKSENAKKAKPMTEAEMAQAYRLMQAQQIIDWVCLQEQMPKARRRPKTKSK